MVSGISCSREVVAYAQAETGDVQSGAGAPPDCERSNRIAAQLSVLLGPDRTHSNRLPSSSALPSHAALSRMRSIGEVHRRRGVIVAGRTQSPLGSDARLVRAVLISSATS